MHGKLTRSGFLTQRTRDVEEKYTLKPVGSPNFPAPPPLRCYKRVGAGQLLLPRHATEAAAEGVEDVRPEPEAAEGLSFRGALRAGFQEEAVAKTLQSLRGVGGAVLSLAPGQGKTACAFYCIAALRKKTLVLVHKNVLADQWEERARQFLGLETLGRIQGDRWDVEGRPVVVAMIQTLCAKEWDPVAFDAFGMVVVDEAHHVPAQVFSRAMFLMSPQYTLGLTATPDRADKCEQALYWFLGPQSYLLRRECEAGSAAYAVLRWEAGDALGAPPTRWDGTLSQAEWVTALAECEERTDVIVRAVDAILRAEPGRRVIVLTDRREHVANLVDAWGAHRAGAYVGGMKRDALEASSVKDIIVATYGLASEGLDIPELDTVVLATPRSDVRQAIGRAMRDGGARRYSTLIVDVLDAWGGSVGHAMHNKRRRIYSAQNIDAVPDFFSTYSLV